MLEIPEAQISWVAFSWCLDIDAPFWRLLAITQYILGSKHAKSHLPSQFAGESLGLPSNPLCFKETEIHVDCAVTAHTLSEMDAASPFLAHPGLGHPGVQ